MDPLDGTESSDKKKNPVEECIPFTLLVPQGMALYFGPGTELML